MASNLKGRMPLRTVSYFILEDRSMDVFVGAFGVKWKGFIGLTLVVGV